jgi:hypothetical protein
MLAAHERLTDKDQEDWLLIVDGDDLYLTALREYGGMTHMRYVVTTVSGLKAGGSKGTIETETGLGCITVVLPTDAEEEPSMYRPGFKVSPPEQGLNQHDQRRGPHRRAAARGRRAG